MTSDLKSPPDLKMQDAIVAHLGGLDSSASALGAALQKPLGPIIIQCSYLVEDGTLVYDYTTGQYHLEE
jgi:hypothetical protein